ncbi:MAG: M10 family metallopeptidase C-terminal domain-containing protein [Hyphomonadaceae bacterium]
MPVPRGWLSQARENTSGPFGPQFFVPPTSGVAANGLPIFNWDQAAAQLTRQSSGWAGLGNPANITFGFRSSAPATMPDDTSGFLRFNATQIAVAIEALALWSAVANITFTRVDDGDGYTNSATMLFGNYSAGVEGASAFAYYPGSTAASASAGDVWINFSLASNNSNLVTGAFGPHTMAHEIGHAIGLAHPANYNSTDGADPTYPESAVYWQDGRMFTVMSYFGSTALGGSLNAFAAGPQLHDIAAAQRLYGANLSTRTGDTTYGFNSNTGHEQFTLTADGQSPVFAIWDAGGNDTLDLSGYSTPVEIDLRAEAFSSAGPGNGGTGNAIGNIAIARGVVIENGIGGANNDVIIGNDTGNTLQGRSGADRITGFGGGDILDGGAGADEMIGGLGDDLYIVDDTGDTLTELSGEGFDQVLSSVSFTLAANVDMLTLTGSAFTGAGNSTANQIVGTDAYNQLFGVGGNDRLIGSGGGDILDGGAGADEMIGGLGDDQYIVDNAGDTIIELAGEGFDQVLSSVSFTLAGNVDMLTLTGAAFTGTGNGGANQLVGADVYNILSGLGGNDRLFGMGGGDILDGGTGGDEMIGGPGDDLYIVDSASDTLTELSGEGFDQVQSSVSFTLAANVDMLTLTGSAFTGTGNSTANQIVGADIYNILSGLGGNDRLFGMGGGDILDGGAGADEMIGGLGDDLYIVDNAGDTLTEVSGEGFDQVQSAVSFTLAANVDMLTLTGSAFTGTGNSTANQIVGTDVYNILSGVGGNDRLIGMGGGDILDGGAGADEMIGGLGDDVYIVDDAGDTLTEISGEGFDQVMSSVSYTLAANVDMLTLTGSADINATGNSTANQIVGNSGANIIAGGGGNDLLEGGLGDDTFVFSPGGGSDRVTDFVAGGTDDDLDLSAYAGTGITWVIAQVGADTVFMFSNGDSITLLNVTASNLTHPSEYTYG